MPKFEMGQDVVLRGRVVDEPWANHIVIQTGDRKHFIREDCLDPDVTPSPIMVKCDKCGVERPLTNIKTAQARLAALGLSNQWGKFTLQEVVRFCAELAEKGVTPQQFMEGL